jgi:hypothetical protein
VNRAGKKFFLQNRQKNIRMQFFLIEIEIEISLLTKITAPGGHIQITIMIDTQQQYMKLNIRGEISIILKNNYFTTILRLIRRVRQFERREINKKCFLYAETYYMALYIWSLHISEIFWKLKIMILTFYITLRAIHYSTENILFLFFFFTK